VSKNGHPILSRLWTKVHDISGPFSFQCTCPIMYIMFRSEDITR